MRIAILTSNKNGVASRAVQPLKEHNDVDLVAIIYSRNNSRKTLKYFTKKIKKILKIGIFGALNGFRIRKWFIDPLANDIHYEAKKNYIPFHNIEYINCSETITLLSNLDLDLVFSLGNSYISEKVYKIPKFGVINLHTEILPDFAGAQPLLWSIYHKRDYSGYTFHQINNLIDNGDIILQEKFTINYQNNLKNTVSLNLSIMRNTIPIKIIKICENYDQIILNKKSQKMNKTFTTPNIYQFFKMVIINYLKAAQKV